MTTAELITAECNAIKAMLLAKNAANGDSALQPLRIFSRADNIEQLRVRIDDKLSRIATMGPEPTIEDTTGDLIWYLVLYRIACRPEPTVHEDGDVRVVSVEERAECAYWRFDARRKGHAEWKGHPMGERDAFKAEMRIALRPEPMVNESLDVGYTVPPFPSDSDDDPAVVHIAPDRTSRAPLPDECLGALCGRRSPEHLAAQLMGDTDGY